MVYPTEVAVVAAACSAQIAQEAYVCRGSKLLSSDGCNRFLLSDGEAGVKIYDDFSNLGTCCESISTADLFNNPHTSTKDASASLSFVCMSPSTYSVSNAAPLAALAAGSFLRVLTCEQSNVSVVGTLLTPEALPWLSASWHPNWVGLLAAICQAEVRVALCVTASHSVDGPHCHSNADKDPTLHSVRTSPASAIPGTHQTPPSPIQHVVLELGHMRPLEALNSAASANGANCPSPHCHTAWVGGAADNELIDDRCNVTLVVAWGLNLELITWDAAHIRNTAAAVAAATAGSPAAAATQSQAGSVQKSPRGCEGGRATHLVPPLMPTSRRELLLGVPGSLSAMVSGPYGSVLATMEAGLALVSTPHQQQAPVLTTAADTEQKLSARCHSDAVTCGSNSGQKEVLERRSVDDKGGALALSKPDVVDLRGSLMGTRFQSPGDLVAGPSLTGLLNIATGRLQESEGFNRDGVATVPDAFLLGSKGEAAVAEVAPASLCVVWPGGLGIGPLAQARSLTTASPCSAGARPLVGGGFCSQAALPMPRPDMLTCCGSLVVAASSMGPPVVAAFELSPCGGLTRLALLAPSIPGLLEPACSRLRGMAVVRRASKLPPSQPCGVKGAARQLGSQVGDGDQAGRSDADGSSGDAVLIVVVGQIEGAAASKGIIGFGRSARHANVKLSPLLASAHPLPSRLTIHALSDAAATAPDIDLATGFSATATAGAPSNAQPPLGEPRGSALETGVLVRAGESLGTAVMDAPPTVSVSTVDTESAAAATSGVGPAIAPGPVATQAAETAGADLAASLMGHLSALLGDLRAHVDQRLDLLTGSLEVHAARLDRIEAAVAAQQGLQKPEK